MFLDLLSQGNFISFNITLAQILGLEPAIYCSELISIYRKAKSKGKIIGDEFFKLDRKYMFNRTTIPIERQLEIDQRWEKVKLLFKHQDNPDIIKLDIHMIANIVSGEDVKIKSDLSNILNPNISKIKNERHQKRIEKLKSNIKCSDERMLKSLQDWVDVMSERGGTNKISEQSVEIFQDTLYRYTNGDVEKALQIVKIAIVQKYPDCQWAINTYERDMKMRAQNELFSKSRMPKTPPQKKATKDSLGDVVF